MNYMYRYIVYSLTPNIESHFVPCQDELGEAPNDDFIRIKKDVVPVVLSEV